MNAIKIAEMLTRQHKDFSVEGFSEYMNGYYNGIIAAIEYIEKQKDIQNNNGRPEWLTKEIEEKFTSIWNSHKTIDDHLRVTAIKYLKDEAKAVGYSIGLNKAMEIAKFYCNI
jgi:hypothetical protein